MAVSTDPEPPMIHILNRWSGNFCHFELCTLVLFLVIRSNLIALTFRWLILSLLKIIYSFVPYVNVFTQSNVWNLVSSLPLKGILLTFMVYISRVSLNFS